MLDNPDGNRPMATLRLFAETLVPAAVDRIFARKADFAAAVGQGLLRRNDGSHVPARTGTWFITTEREDIGNNPQDHLRWIINLLSQHMPELREHIPALQADFSLLVHDRNFDISKLPPELVRQAVAAGDLEVEIPSRDIDIVVTKENLAEYLAH